MKTSLSMPSHIRAAGIADDQIQHDWSELIEESITCPDPRLGQRLRAISYRAGVSLSVGSLEWIAWRLHKHINDPVVFQVIEATWAGIIDWRYLEWHDLPPPNWEEELPWPVEGPLTMAVKLLGEIVSQVSHGQPDTGEAAALVELPLYVLKDQEPYKEWRRFAIRRLTEAHPIQREDRQGTPVPREALEPERDYKPEAAAQLLSAYLQGLDHTKNPYLRSPDDMIADGYKGIPYSV
jgi:hypothetical protein